MSCISLQKVHWFGQPRAEIRVRKGKSFPASLYNLGLIRSHAGKGSVFTSQGVRGCVWQIPPSFLNAMPSMFDHSFPSAISSAAWSYSPFMIMSMASGSIEKVSSVSAETCGPNNAVIALN